MRFAAAITLFSLAVCACQGEATIPGGTSPNAVDPAVNNATTGTPPPDVELPPFVPPRPKMRRLSRAEYENTIHDLFGQFVVVPDLEPDTPVNGFSAIGNAKIATSRLGVEKYETAALSIAEQVLGGPARNNLLDCVPQDFIDGPCATNFVEKVGPRILRRPLTPQEIQRYSTVAQLGMRDLSDFWLGLELGLAAMLQSPHFLYRTEWGESDGPTQRRLTAYEIASRLSYLVWASAPDDTLLAAAGDGALDTADGVQVQLRRMLENPRSDRGLRSLWDEFLELDRLANKIKDPELYPEFGPELAFSMREETLLLLEHYMNSDKDFREVFSTRTTFVDRRLATLYGVDVGVNAAPDEFVQVELPDDGPRRGILGHASFLAGHAHAAQTSPTHRGLFVRQSLLCLPIPPPPPNVDTTIQEGVGVTLRERMTVHMENEGCAGCHKLMDPIGFGFENFDAIGRYRDTDNGAPVDATGELDGDAFVDADGLAGLVAQHPALTTCMVRKLYRHALGHVEEDTEEVLIRDLVVNWEADGFRFHDLLYALVASDGFLYVEGE